VKYSITKTFYFDAAHRLLESFTRKCRSLHGHTYKVKLSLQADQLDANGMVIDFGELKPFKDYLKQHFDHAVLLQQGDPLIKPLTLEKQKITVLEKAPTSEILASLFLNEGTKLLENKNARVSAVEVYESSTSRAEVKV